MKPNCQICNSASKCEMLQENIRLKKELELKEQIMKKWKTLFN